MEQPALQTQFKFSEVVTKKILELGCRTLSDFRFMVQDEAEVKTCFIDQIQNLPNERLETARVRHAWSACKALVDAQRVQATQPPTVEDEDALLPSDELQDLKTMWFKRYHLKPDPSCMPSDRLISKLVRALRKKTLEVIDVWSVRSLTHQLTHSTKRRKVGDNLFLQEVDDSEEGRRNWATYLKKLEIYCLALSIAGIKPVEPPPTEPETINSESTKYVIVPLDVLMRYKTRAEELAGRVGEGQRLQLVSQLDGQERAEWSARYGASTDSLGQTIVTLMRERDALWISGSAGSARYGASTDSLGQTIVTLMRERDALWISGSAGAPSSSARPSSPAAPPRGDPASSVAGMLRDGTKLCPDFQKGKGAHRCGFVLSSGRPCGSFGHGADKCTGKKQR
eukprot:s173_g18.t1